MTTASGEGDVTCGYAPLGTKPAGSLKAGLPLFAPAFWPVSGKAGQKHQNIKTVKIYLAFSRNPSRHKDHRAVSKLPVKFRSHQVCKLSDSQEQNPL